MIQQQESGGRPTHLHSRGCESQGQAKPTPRSAWGQVQNEGGSRIWAHSVPSLCPQPGLHPSFPPCVCTLLYGSGKCPEDFRGQDDFSFPLLGRAPYLPCVQLSAAAGKQGLKKERKEGAGDRTRSRQQEGARCGTALCPGALCPACGDRGQGTGLVVSLHFYAKYSNQKTVLKNDW